MNAQKSIAVVAAMLITAAGMVGIVNYTNAAASAADHGINATSQVIRTLPTINVHPSSKQMRELRGDQAGVSSANLRMPYYSFASDTTGA